MQQQYDNVVEAVETLARRGWQRQTLVEADGYPIFALESRSPHPKAQHMLIVAGVHGEEPAAVVGTVAWLLNRSPEWTSQINFTVIPCLNPWGFERGIRFGPHGLDLNREFDAPKHAYTEAVTDYLRHRSFDLFMDQHEDCDFHTMYAYELPSGYANSLARHILYVMEPVIPLSHGDGVEPFETDRGLVLTDHTTVDDLADVEAVLGDGEQPPPPHLEGLPIALWAIRHLTNHTVTTETPGMLPLPLRATAHEIALTEACHFLTASAGQNTSDTASARPRAQ